LVARLQQEVPSLVTQDDVALCFSACRGNVRETFFALYDLYESRRGQREQHGPSDEGR
jgi:hypothetical protein